MIELLGLIIKLAGIALAILVTTTLLQLIA